MREPPNKRMHLTAYRPVYQPRLASEQVVN
jgi:hypothetical protein